MSSMFRGLIGDEKENSTMDDFNKACTLSYTTRMYGFALFFIIGVVLTIISAFLVTQILDGHPERFALTYSLGAICSLASTMFLMGPWSQIKSMFARKRIIATCVYLASIIMTLVMALTIANIIVVLLCILVQAIALFWYSISYIPYARTAICSCFKGMFSA